MLRRLCLLAAFCLPFALSAKVRSLTILHVNDLHAHISPEDGKGGFAYVLAVLQRERAGCTDCILLNAGDLVQGSPVSTIYRGVPIFELSNLLGIDVACLGNHELDYGWARIADFVKTAKYPIVAANVLDAKGRPVTRKPYAMLHANGLRIAVIGAMTDELNHLTTPKSLGELHTSPVGETVRRYARELRNRSDLVILLGHISAREEHEILNTVPEIPVSVTGHIHTGLSEALTQDGRVLVRVKGYADEIGRLELKVDTEKKSITEWHWKRIAVDPASLTPDPEMAKRVKSWEDIVSAQVDRPLAIAARTFDKHEVKLLIEQALRDETHSDFAWMNLDGVRATLPKGQLLDRNIWEVMPFDNEILVGTFKGRDLPKVLTDGKTVDADRDYTLAVSDYTAANQETRENFGRAVWYFPGTQESCATCCSTGSARRR